jgi:hypothetical protein
VHLSVVMVRYAEEWAGGYSDGDEGQRVARKNTLEPQTNGDGLPIVPMSPKHKYIFDVKGW